MPSPRESLTTTAPATPPAAPLFLTIYRLQGTPNRVRPDDAGRGRRELPRPNAGAPCAAVGQLTARIRALRHSAARVAGCAWQAIALVAAAVAAARTRLVASLTGGRTRHLVLLTHTSTLGGSLPSRVPPLSQTFKQSDLGALRFRHVDLRKRFEIRRYPHGRTTAI